MTTVVEEFVAKLGWDIDSRELQTFQRQARGLKDTARSAFYGATVAATGLAAAIWKVSSAFSVIEDAEAAFTPLLGGAERAATMVERLNTMAAKTPFEFTNLADATKQLLPSMGGDINRTIASIQMLGDTAQGNAQKMQSVVRGYNRILIKGKANLEGLNIIAEAGVPIYDQLTKTLGFKNGAAMFDAVSAGKVSAEDVTKTFKAMTSQGGIFFQGMEIASRTLSGKLSTLRDDATMALAAIGKELSPTLKDVVDDLSGVAQSVKKWASANGALIRVKFREYVQDVRDFLKDLVSFGGKVKGVIDDLGGFGPTLRLVATGFAAIKIAPFLTTMISITKQAPTMGAALASAGKVALKGWGPFAMILTALPYAVEDLQSTWSGQASFIQRNVIDPIMRFWGAYDGLNQRQIEATSRIRTNMLSVFGSNWYDPILKGLDLVISEIWADMKAFGEKFYGIVIKPIWDGIYEVIGFISRVFGIGGGGDSFIADKLGVNKLSFADRVRELKGAPLKAGWKNDLADSRSGTAGSTFLGLATSKSAATSYVTSGVRGGASKSLVIQSTPKVDISVSSNASDPKAVAKEVRKEMERTFVSISDNMLAETMAAM